VGAIEERNLIMAERQRSQQVVQVTLAALSLGSLLFGCGIYMFSARLGVAQDTARIIASAFLLAAIADALVLYLWQRIFRS
jgi:hypothetical protein